MKFLTSSDKIALYCREEEISYRSLIGWTASLARQHGVGTKERVVICAENQPGWIAAFYSAWRTQSIPVPIDVTATVDEIAYVLKDCQPSAIFTSKTVAPNLQAAATEAGCDARMFILEDHPAPTEVAPGDDDFPDSPMDDIAVIIYTSGTTGSPKGVMLSFANLYANLTAVSDEVPIYRPDSRVLVLLPLHHVLPLQGTVIMPLTIHAACVMVTSLAAADILETLSRQPVTIFVGVPRLFVLLRDGLLNRIRQRAITRFLFWLTSQVNSLAFSRLVFRAVQKKFGGAMKYMPSGGAALDPQVIKDFRALGFEILVGYGMTETAPMISFTRPGATRLGSAGQLVTCNEVRIVGGEITVRGGNVMRGYYNREEETAAVMKDGWLYTGDLGYVDQDDYIYITGRKKEIIVLPNGKNINPDEVEQKLLGITDLVAEVAVLESGDALHALILPNMKALADAGITNIEDTIRQQVINAYNAQTSSYKRILKCTFVRESLPRTKLGKLKRHELPALAVASGQKTAKAVKPEPDLEEYRVIKEYLTREAETEVHPDDHFEIDLGLDSLRKVSFLAFLNVTFGQDIKEQTLAEYSTPAQLATYLHEAGATIARRKGLKWGEILREKVAVKLPKSWFAHHWVNFCSGTLLRCAFRLRGEGMENVPEGPCIFAPNHQSYLDGFLISAFLKKDVFKDTFFYAKAEHLKRRWQRFFANWHNIIIMDVNSDLKLSLQKLASALQAGKKVIIFPEGTRTRDGQLGNFKKAFAILGQELGVPIVPVALQGAYEALPRTRLMPRFFQPVKVTFLPPIQPIAGDDYNNLVDKVIDALKTALGKAPSEQA